jgi:hypothetical protein
MRPPLLGALTCGALTAFLPLRAQGAACCLSASVVGAGRLVAWEEAAGGLNTSWARGVARFDASGTWRARPVGSSEDELRAEAWASVRLWQPLQLSLRAPFVVGVRSAGSESSIGGGLGDVAAALRWEAVGLGAYEWVPGIALTGQVIAPSGTRPELASDALGASASGRGAVTFGLGAAFEYAMLPWFVRLDVGGTMSAPFKRADTGATQTLGPQVQAALSVGREFLADALILAGALRFEHERPYAVDGASVPGSQGTLLGAAFSAALKLSPNWQVLASVSGDAVGLNREQRFGASLGGRYGHF